MSANNGDLPVDAQTQYDSEGDPVEYMGLTKREHFAGLAMQGMLASKFVGDFGTEINDDSYTMSMGLANNAVRYADALLEELGK